MRLLPLTLLFVRLSFAQTTQPDKAKTGDDEPKSPAIAQREAVEAAMQAGLKEQTDSVQKQQDSLSKQMATSTISDANFIVPMLKPPDPVDCAALTAAEVDPLINDAAQRESLEPKLIRAVMKQESGFKPCAFSYKGAQGLMQLMPQTAYELHVADPWDPKQNIDGGAALLKRLLDKYKGDLKLVLAAYNAGSNMVDSAGGIPDPKETQDYVARIVSDLGSSPGAPPGATAPAQAATNAPQTPQ
jgi:soluble lytic murein transglycosylase-like protein